MLQPGEQPAPQVLKRLHDAFPDLSQQQALQPRHALTVVSAHLRQKPMAFAAAPGPAVADCRRPVGPVAQPRRRRGGELPLLQPDPRPDQVPDQVFRAACRHGGTHKRLSLIHRLSSSAGTVNVNCTCAQFPFGMG